MGCCIFYALVYIMYFLRNNLSGVYVVRTKVNNVIAWVYALQWKKKAKNEVKQGAPLSPSQTTARRAHSLIYFFDLADLFFAFFRHCGSLYQATDVRIH